MSVTIIRSAIGSLPSVGILRVFRENGIRVIGTDITDACVGKFFVDGFYVVPVSSEKHAISVLEAYEEIIRKESVGWILSAPENEVLLLSQYEDFFKERQCHLLHPETESLHIITDKYKLYNFLKQHDVTTPETILLNRAVSHNPGVLYAENAAKIVIKPAKGRGSSGTFIIERKHSDKFLQWVSMSPEKYIVQEFIDGEEYTVDVLCDMQSRVLNIVPRQRIKIDSGITIIGKTVKNKKLVEILSDVLKFLPLRGFSCVQFIKRGSEYFLTDINPRIGGGSILSLESSQVLKDNLINLLKGDWEKLVYDVNDFKEIEMLRYYEELYQII